MDYRTRVVIITGASSGIGYETALAFAKRGATVVVTARREALLERLLKEMLPDSPKSSYLCGDLGQREFAERVVRDTVARHGRLDVLVNNAAISKHKHIYHVDADEADFITRVNYLSPVWMTLAALPAMLDQGEGFLINVSSFAAKVAPPREGLYAASKAALNLFTEGLWNDLAGSNIHAAIVNPGPIDTEIWDKEDEPPAFKGKKYPPRIVVDAIFEAIEKRRFEITTPKRNPSLISARVLRAFAPALMRRGMAMMEPVPAELLARARERARSSRAKGGDER